jgi:hypothetical protein
MEEKLRFAVREGGKTVGSGVVQLLEFTLDNLKKTLALHDDMTKLRELKTQAVNKGYEKDAAHIDYLIGKCKEREEAIALESERNRKELTQLITPTPEEEREEFLRHLAEYDKKYV